MKELNPIDLCNSINGLIQEQTELISDCIMSNVGEFDCTSTKIGKIASNTLRTAVCLSVYYTLQILAENGFIDCSTMPAEPQLRVILGGKGRPESHIE